jgi:hypothetical protein
MKTSATLFAGCLVVAAVTALAESPAVTALEPWSNLFAGKEAVFHARLDGETFDGRLMWQFLADGRTIARGERPVKLAPGGRETVEIRLAVPDMNPGVCVRAQLSVSAVPAGEGKAVAGLDRTLWLFPSDPFTGRAEWLKKLDIRLFDPVGATAKIFDDSKVPYTAIRNVDSLGDPKEGILIVGEGVSFRDYRGLGDSLIKAAAAGWPILCLAPAGGEMVLPVRGGADLPEPRSMSLRRQDVVQELDKRLDAGGWKNDGKPTGSGLKIRGDRGPVVAEAVNEPGAWPWVDMAFDKGRGRRLVCGFGVVGGWAESPTPRFLLVKVLEHVSGMKLRD